MSVTSGPAADCNLSDCGTPATEAVTFGLDGQNYLIDLCETHAEELRDDIEEFIGPARLIRRRRPGSMRSTPDPAPPPAVALPIQQPSDERARQTVDRLRAAGERVALSKRMAREQDAKLPADGTSLPSATAAAARSIDRGVRGGGPRAGVAARVAPTEPPDRREPAASNGASAVRVGRRPSESAPTATDPASPRSAAMSPSRLEPAPGDDDAPMMSRLLAATGLVVGALRRRTQRPR